MTESFKCEPRKRSRFNMRRLRISLKYRPDIMKIILKMKQCINRKNSVIKKLKHKLKQVDPLQNISNHNESTENIKYESKCESDNSTNKHLIINSSTQTDNNNSKIPSTDNSEVVSSKVLDTDKDDQTKNIESGWDINKEDGEEKKSIAEQVKEVAQSAMQQSGMVYVESAGMYYDYKTGYYYNSELGLYYHSDTGCYYYYSEEKKTFVFHSYPEPSAVDANAKLAAYEKRKAKKHRMEKKKEDAIDNLTKNLSQDKEDESEQASKRKRRKIVKKPKVVIEKKPSVIENKDQDVIKTEVVSEKEKDISPSEKQEGNEDVVKVVESKDEELEDGECSESDSEAIEISDEDDVSEISTSTASDDESIAKHHPPCMRIIVRETNLPKLKVGSLFLITKDGGTLGREGDHHTIVIRDHNVSRNHLDVRYDTERSSYVATDLGSKNGSILNGNRMSESQVVSNPMEIMHGSVIQLGETKLLCHIHPGNDTCGHCEPGLLLESQEKDSKAAYTRTCSVQKQHQLELARLKNKYAPKPLAIEETAYNDRAQVRRETVGSSHHSEKTKTSDVDTFIEPENKGFKLLEKMGWSKGEGLGKYNHGGTEPVPLISNEGKAGLGTSGATGAPAPRPVVMKNTLGSATLRLASKTKMLQPPAKAFQESFDEDSE